MGLNKKNVLVLKVPPDPGSSKPARQQLTISIKSTRTTSAVRHDVGTGHVRTGPGLDNRYSDPVITSLPVPVSND